MFSVDFILLPSTVFLYVRKTERAWWELKTLLCNVEQNGAGVFFGQGVAFKLSLERFVRKSTTRG